MRLDDLGLVTDSIAEPRTFARFDGSPVWASALCARKAQAMSLSGIWLQARIETIKKDYPDVELKLIDTSVTYTLGNYHAARCTPSMKAPCSR